MLSHYLTKSELETIKSAGFDEHGLRFSLEELQKETIQNKTLQQVSEYVDAITFIKVNQNDVDFLKPQLKDPQKKVPISMTGLGNLAYIILNIKDDSIKHQAEKLYHYFSS